MQSQFFVRVTSESPHHHQIAPKLWNQKMRNINLELRIRNFKFQVLDIQVFFPSQQFSKQKNCKTLQFLCATKTKPVEVDVKFLYPLETSEKHRYLMLSGDTKGNIEPKWATTTISARVVQFDIVSLKQQQFNNRTAK